MVIALKGGDEGAALTPVRDRGGLPMHLLAVGSRGPEVETLQAALNFYLPRPPKLVVDGIFGPKTRARVVEFQGRQGLAADGIVGPKTEAVLFACVSIAGAAFVTRRPQGTFLAALPSRGNLLALAPTAGPGPINLPPLNLPPLQRTQPPPFLPPFLMPPPALFPTMAGQLAAGGTVVWGAFPSQWELFTLEMTVLSRRLQIKGEIEAERHKSSTTQFDVSASATARWTLLPEKYRTPSVFLEAGAKAEPDQVAPRAGLGLGFKGNTLIFSWEHQPAFDIDPQGRAGSDIKVPETNYMFKFEGAF
jgi:hypothetical protein